MPAKQRSPRVKRAAADIGTQLTAWRKLQNLTTQQVAERANIGLSTLRRVEHGDPGVTLETLLGVLRALGALDRMVDALDPFTTDLGRARAGLGAPEADPALTDVVVPFDIVGSAVRAGADDEPISDPDTPVGRSNAVA